MAFSSPLAVPRQCDDSVIRTTSTSAFSAAFLRRESGSQQHSTKETLRWPLPASPLALLTELPEESELTKSFLSFRSSAVWFEINGFKMGSKRSFER